MAVHLYQFEVLKDYNLYTVEAVYLILFAL